MDSEKEEAWKARQQGEERSDVDAWIGCSG